MTAAFDHCSHTISQLIDSCWKAAHGFRSASEAVGNDRLKTLLSIYAHQSGRFAEELRNFAACEPNPLRSGEKTFEAAGSEADVLVRCLEREKHTLALYRQALSEQKLSTRARFLVSAQLALLERVHSRMQTLHPQSDDESPASRRRLYEDRKQD